MILSHSKLQTLLTNPMDYYLNYKEGIKLKEQKPFFIVGSAVHWGLENNTEELAEYFEKNGNAIQRTTYSQEQFQAEAMVHGFYCAKPKIMKELFEDGQINLIDEYHELDVKASLKSFKYKEPHTFIGIIDLLYLTDKGFILVDYKTSSMMPDFNKYLDQLYRYIFELNSIFPDIPVYKIAIINLIKSKIKRLSNESDFDFKRRYKAQYEKEYNHLINLHVFDPSNIEKNKMDDYMVNLSKAADLAQTIDESKLYWLNMEGAKNPYPSIYLPIYENEKNCYMDYKIKDKFFNEVNDKIENERDCIELDMKVVSHDNVLNKYDMFKIEADLMLNQLGVKNKEELFKELKSKFLCDDYLLENYWYIYNKEISANKDI